MNFQRDLILKAKKAYYEGNPIMSDDAFDTLLENYVNDHPEDSLPVETLEDNYTSEPYLSLKKMKTEEFLSWCFGKKVFIADKVDGVSIELTVVKGEIVRAITRGGKDRTKQVQQFLGEMYFGSNPCPLLRMRGELFIPRATFERKFKKDFANARNLTAGAVNSVNNLSEDLKEVGEFIAWRVMDGLDFKSHGRRLRYLSNYLTKSWSIMTTFPRFYDSVSGEKLKELEEFLKINESGEEIRSSTPYEIDGLVAFMDDLEYWGEESNDSHHVNAVAWKFTSLKATSIVREVVWSRGSSGNVTPVIKIDPVEIGGVTVKSINMFNYENLQSHNVGIGSTIIVERAGDVIPHLHQNITPEGQEVIKIDKPTECPLCESELIQDKKSIKCINPECSGNWKHPLIKYASIMDVKFMSEEIFEGLEQCYYEQDEKFSHPLIWLLCSDKDDFDSFITEGKLERFWSNLEESKKKLDQIKLISCMGVPSFSEKRFKSLFKTLKITSIQELYDDFVKKWHPNEQNMKPSDRDAIMYLKNNIDHLEEFLAYSNGKNLKPFEENEISGMEVVITGSAGSLKRKELKDLLQSNGIVLADSVNERTKFLICDDPNSSSSKMKKAQTLGTTIITWEDFSQSQLNS